MKQQLLKVDLCVMRWVEAENKRRKALTVEDKEEEGFEPTRTSIVPSLVTADEQAVVLTRLVEAFPHGSQCKGATIKDLRTVLTRERSAQKKKVEQGKEKAATATAIKGNTLGTASNILGDAIEVEIMDEPAPIASMGATATATATSATPATPASVPVQQWLPVKAFDFDDFLTVEQSLAVKNPPSEG